MMRFCIKLTWGCSKNPVTRPTYVVPLLVCKAFAAQPLQLVTSSSAVRYSPGTWGSWLLAMTFCHLAPCLLWIAAIAVASAPSALGADVAFRESFDGPELAWKLRPGSEGQIVAQVRQSVDAGGRTHSCETVTAAIAPGYSIYLDYLVDPAPVIEELKLEVQVRANRPGLQLAAEVVYPRAVDPATGLPRRSVITGDRYARSGEWQRLELTQVPLQARRQARLLSSSFKEAIDPAQAYVDRIILIVPGGAGESRVDTDELTVTGAMFRTPTLAKPVPSEHGEGAPTVELQGPLLDSPRNSPSGSVEMPSVEVRRQGSALAIQGVPCLPRIIQHQGESFEQLARLGFNTIWLDHVPTEEELNEAHRAKVWIVCPPPSAEQLRAITPSSEWQAVLAWVVGEHRNGIHLDSVRSLADSVRNNDLSLSRPLMVHAEGRQQAYGRLADVVVRSHRPGGMAIDKRISGGPREALIGCVSWGAIETRWTDSAAAQLLAFSPRNPDATLHEPIAIRDAVLAELTSGARGIVIRSGDNLTAKQPAVERLALQLSLINNELRLLEPWLVMGKELSSVEIDGTSLTATSWQLDRARLILVPSHQVPTTSTDHPYGTLSVAGVAETATAHLVTATGLLPLEVQRGAAGIRVVTGNLSAGGLVLLTDDSRAIAQLKSHTGKQAEKIANSERSLAMSELVRLEAIMSQRNPGLLQDVRQTLESFKASLIQCDLFIASGDYARGGMVAQALRRAIYNHGEMLCRTTASEQGAWESWPTSVNVGALPAHETLRQAVAVLPRGPNLLAGGDFENLQQVKQAGWSHARAEESHWQTQVEFTANSPRHGRGALRLTAQLPASNVGMGTEDGQPIVWITSPSIPLSPGALLEVTGWARVTPNGQGGGLIVVDSLGGDELAVRIPATRDWEPFKLVRSVDQLGSIRINFAIDGATQAEVDAVMVRQILPPQPRTEAAAVPVPSQPK